MLFGFLIFLACLTISLFSNCSIAPENISLDNSKAFPNTSIENE